jgi:hypothetical protein
MNGLQKRVRMSFLAAAYRAVEGGDEEAFLTAVSDLVSTAEKPPIDHVDAGSNCVEAVDQPPEPDLNDRPKLRLDGDATNKVVKLNKNFGL